MVNDSTPTNPTGSRFGWPNPLRIEEFRKLLAVEGLPTMRVVFREERLDLPTIRVPIGLPKYRLANGRTVSLQAEYLAKNEKTSKDLFDRDPELWEVQEVQHELLLELSRKTDLQDYFGDPANKQVDQILLDEFGFVVNGNRRMATWREMLHQNPAKYGHFRNIDVAVLPHGTDQEIDRLEAMLQIEPDIKASYTWDAEANMILAKQKRSDSSIKELAELYSMKEGEVQELLDMRSYADEYLRSRGKQDMWSQVSDDAYAFRRIVTLRPKIAVLAKQELFKELAFKLIDDPSEVGGRLYEQIPLLLESLDAIHDKLEAVFTEGTPTVNTDPDDLFGGASPADAPAVNAALIQEIRKPDNTKETFEIIVDAVETQKQLKRDSKKADSLLARCANAHAQLVAAVKNGLRPESIIVGVEKQLTQLETQIALIRKFLAENAKD